jgi:ribulose-5-phosphate 4-epimerase/fuculose-1-phosphate aldolase
LQAYELRGAGAVLHSHSLNAVMATMLDPNATEFRVTHIEMIKVGRVASSNYKQTIAVRKYLSAAELVPSAAELILQVVVAVARQLHINSKAKNCCVSLSPDRQQLL